MAGYRAVFEELPFLEEWEGLRERATWQRPRPGGGGVASVVMCSWAFILAMCREGFGPPFLPGVACCQPRLHEQHLLEPSTHSGSKSLLPCQLS